MAGDAGAESDPSFEYTPTWTIALTCTVFVLVSLTLERLIHRLGKWFRSHKLRDLNKALDKIKEELMLLGFISLLLTVFQSTLAKLCMPASFAQHMLPCKRPATDSSASSPTASEVIHSRKLLFSDDNSHSALRRMLAGGGGSTYCQDKGKVPFLSIESIHQLHIFIFVLALTHVVLSALTVFFARIKINGWKAWEDEIISKEQDPTKDYRFTKDDSFLKKHAHRRWSDQPFFSWIVSFGRQFGRSVTKDDYQTLRLGFINTHKALNHKYDFHTYVLRSLEDDFKKVVGISGYLWLFVIIFLVLNIHGFETYFWMAFLPLILLLVVGTKLQHIITELALEVAHKHSVVQGDVVVNPRDELFWFRRPKIIIYVMHFILFQNAFEFAFFFWVLTTFGVDSCFMDNIAFIVVRLVVGVFVQILFSYITLPLYALVTQMGSNYKKAIFREPILEGLEGWRDKAKKKKNTAHGGSSPLINNSIL